MNTEWDIIIIGGGPAGLTAAQYAARANMKTVLLEKMSPGGQALMIDGLENYPGLNEPVDGFTFAESLTKQAKKFGAVIELTGAASVDKKDSLFSVRTTNGAVLRGKAVILASGASHRPLGIPGEDRLSGRGVSYCATCDGPFFKDKRIFVVGGGDTACTDAVYLANLSDDVTIVHRKDRFRAQKAVAQKVLRKLKKSKEQIKSNRWFCSTTTADEPTKSRPTPFLFLSECLRTRKRFPPLKKTRPAAFSPTPKWRAPSPDSSAPAMCARPRSGRWLQPAPTEPLPPTRLKNTSKK